MRTSGRSTTLFWSPRTNSTPSTVGFANGGLQHWADPRGTHPGEINHNDGGRGVYFQDPSGHYLEIITKPYGG